MPALEDAQRETMEYETDVNGYLVLRRLVDLDHFLSRFLVSRAHESQGAQHYDGRSRTEAQRRGSVHRHIS